MVVETAMPTPHSPAIDPFIEKTGIWGDFHASLIAAIRDQLNERLPENYAATIEARPSHARQRP